jgi:predicted component of type VI protein secretion system
VIQLEVLSGKPATRDVVVRQFPFLIGRGAAAHLRLEEGGVWERHVQIDFLRGEGFTFAAQSEALTLINGEPRQQGLLRNGDVIGLGSARVRFWLARSPQKTLGLRETLTWLAFFALFTAQAALIAWLFR